jgi:hypothetical protein
VWAVFVFTTEGTVFAKVGEMSEPPSRGESIKGHPPEYFPDLRGEFLTPEMFPFKPM